MILRNFLYLNEQMLDDYLSAIDGYIVEKFSQKTTQSKSKNAGISVNSKYVGGNLGKENVNEVETQMEAYITPASKVQKLIDFLESDGEQVQFYDYVDEDIWRVIQREQIIEFMGTVRFSKLKEITNAISELEKLSEALQDISPSVIIDKNTQKTIQGLKKLSEVQNENEIPCILSFASLKEYQVVCYLDKSCFCVNQESFIGDVTILCKIQKKINKGQTVELTDIFKSFRELPLNREQRRKMPDKKSLETPKDITDTIKGPAFVAIPIAIYK